MKGRSMRLASVAALALAMVLVFAGVAYAQWPDLTQDILDDYDVTESEVDEISDGYLDGTWKPYADMPRRHFAKMAVEQFDGVDQAFPATPTFPDVPTSHEFFGYIEGAAAAGLIEGYSSGFFGPDDIVTREQGAAIIVRFLAGEEGVDLDAEYGDGAELEPFNDEADVSDPLVAEMSAAVDWGVVLGTEDNDLNPLDSLLRIQGAAMLIRAMDVEVEEPGSISGAVFEEDGTTPIEDATVTADGNEATTNADGEYTIDDLAAGTYDVTADADGFVAATETGVEVEAGLETDGIDFSLDASATISGTVTEVDGTTPIEDATVTANGTEATTNADGEYSLEVAAGTYDVTAEATDYVSETVEDVEVAAGDEETVDFSLALESPPSNQSFVVSSADTQLVDARDQTVVEYTASGLTPGEDYEVALFAGGGATGGTGDNASIMSDGNRYPNRNGDSVEGEFTFRDQDLDDLADEVGNLHDDEAEIATLNFDSVGATQGTGTADSNGEIVIRIELTGDSECAIPVVWDDADGDSELDLDGDSTNSWNEPAEDFGVGGAVVFHQGEAPNGHSPSTANDVIFLDLDEQFYVDFDGYQYFWGRSGDSYAYGGTDASGSISEALFEEYLSIDDELTLSPNYDRGGNVNYEINEDLVGVPTNVTVEVIDDDGDGNNDDLRVTWDYPEPLEGNDDQWNVEIRDADDLSLVTDDWTSEVDTLSPRQSETELIFNDQPAGDYVARVGADSHGSETNDGGDYSLLSEAVTLEGPAGPTIESADLETDAVVIGQADVDDVWVLEFSDDMDTTLNPVFDLEDEDGDVIRVDTSSVASDPNDGITDATADWDHDGASDDSTLEITLTEDAEDRNFAGGDDILYTLTIIATNDLEDGTDNVDVDLENSADVTIE